MRRLCFSFRPLSKFRHFSLNVARTRGAVVDVHPEVEDALASNKAVVALETALITHGFPYPANVELALSLEKIVRAQGSVPATIGLIDGRVKIGLDKKDIERLANKENGPAKISRRDIAAAIALKSDGGTTCSATLIFAALAGIKVFATGGLGGVHRGGENSMDVSADLGELTRCPVALVSAGVKSILDIPRTLEYLETLGVPVLTYGATREFPAFFSRHSGVNVPWNVTDPVKAAEVLYKQWQLGMNNGVVFAVPIPEQFEESGAHIQRAVDQAVAESEKNGVSKLGKEATPWLLSRVGELTQGTSRASNIALIENTALIGGKIAVEYQKLTNKPCIATPSVPKAAANDNTFLPANLMIIGSSAVDITTQALGTKNLITHSTSPGVVSLSLGGVARNVAEACHRILSARSSPTSPMLVSPIGDDAFGRLLMEETMQFGMRVDGLISSNRRTAVCNMFLDNEGGLMGGVADMDITAAFEADTVIPLIDKHKPRLIALDGNLSPENIKGIVGHCIKNNIQVFFEPTSVTKSTAIFPAISSSLEHLQGRAPITFISPNTIELAHIFSNAESLGLTAHPAWWRMIDDLSLGSSFRLDLERLARLDADDKDPSRGTLAFLVNEGIAQMAVKLLPFFQHLIIKCGKQGVIVVMRMSKSGLTTESPWASMNNGVSRRRIVAHGKSNGGIVVLQHFPPCSIEKVVNVTGAGDSFVGALLAELADQSLVFDDPDRLANAIYLAQNAAVLTLQSNLAVSPLLSSI